MSTLYEKKILPTYYDEDYFETGTMSGRSCYSYYRWMPEVTLRMAMAMIEYANIDRSQQVLDFGCAKGFVVRAMRTLFRDAYGCDASGYAISRCDPEIEKYVRLSTASECIPYDFEFDICISKDVFEHLAYAELPAVLNSIGTKSKQLLTIVPLGDGQRYLIDAYEDDQSHIIREGVDWWLASLEAAGFKTIKWSRHVVGIKDSWHKINPHGNLVVLSAR
jgi:hypothetical protein